MESMRLADLPRKKSRSARGVRAFTDAEEDHISAYVESGASSREEVAVAINCSLTTLETILSRSRRRRGRKG